LRSNVAAATAALLFFFALGTERANAVPIFAQRYHLNCTACHSVLPELNAFGNYFRSHGYRLPLPVHGTTIFAMRYQMAYATDPAAGSRRWTPGGIVLGAADLGPIAAFIHYSLGAGGGPGGTYLAYLARYDEHTNTLYRFGLFELPLLQSPGQRLDDLQQYGYYGTHVGLNNVPPASPRWGMQVERSVGDLRIDGTLGVSAYQGAAYGGKPVDTGETTSFSGPELGLWLDQKIFTQGSLQFEAGGEALGGSLRVLPTGRPSFADLYQRYGLFAHGTWHAFDFQAEQWWGTDHDADGYLTDQHSSGGYARLKYYPIDHAYVGIRYDASANPGVARDWTYYAAGMIAPFRLLIQEVQPIPGKATLGGAMTVAFPGFWKL
jgi:hypothetical protein